MLIIARIRRIEQLINKLFRLVIGDLVCIATTSSTLLLLHRASSSLFRFFEDSLFDNIKGKCCKRCRRTIDNLHGHFEVIANIFTVFCLNCRLHLLYLHLKQ